MQNSPESRPATEPIRAGPRRGAGVGVLLLILAIAAVLRLGGLGAESLWFDEVMTISSARVPFPRVIQAVRQYENPPPFYFVVVNAWVKCFGMSDVALRLPSALMGIATVALMWRVGTEWVDSTVGLTAAALLAVAPIHIAYSQEARMYALLVLLLTLNLLAVVRVMRTGSTRWQVVYVVTAALALFTHTFAAFTLTAVNLFWLVRLMRRGETGVTLRRWATLNAAVIVLFGPWIPATLGVAGAGLPWLKASTSFADAMIGYAGGLTSAIAMGGLCAVAVIQAWRRRDDRVFLLVLLALVPVIGPIAYGTFTTRYGIAAMIGLTLLAARGAAGIGRWACVAVVLLAALSWGMTSTVGHARYRNYTPKADVRGAVEFVRGQAEPGDVAVAGSRAFWHVMDHYARGTGLRICLDFDEAEREQAERVWLVTEPGANVPAAGYEVKSRRSLDHVEVIELQRSSEPATTTGVPSTYPRN